ncbi:MAG: 4Fe-4S dicluster domain-containing protein [Planctomycetota bacterium]
MSCEPRSTAGTAGKALSLPVLGTADADGHAPKGPRAPHSGMGRRRAIVLVAIQLLMIVHVVQWLWTGTTIKPIEPSEAMETAKDGVITVGTVFFALALLSTALLGRWFCGWGCHVVMLQDWCGHLMKKAGIRPRLFRSRLLLWLPLALAVYMFLWPVFYRLAIAPYTRPELAWPGFTTSFTTSEFWSTFPGWLMAVPFLLVCGFLTVYLLGAKGYCTYACPYGGFFAPLDELSPVRIRVTDACTQCGHCTAVCTSNVRVHEEVRDWKMVVDQGCMKCMDCVSACPEHALRVGWGTPAFLAKPVVAAPAPRRHDLTINQELALAAVAVGSFLAVRGALGVPLLFASGIAACATFLAWILWRMVAERDVRLHRTQLKRDGRVRGAGAAIGAGTLAALGGIAYLGVVNAAIALADFQLSRVNAAPESVFSGSRMEPSAPERASAERGRVLYAFASGLAPHGPWTRELEVREAWLSAVVLDYGRAESILRARAARDGLDEQTAAGIARVMRGRGDLEGALAFSREQWQANPAWEGLREELVTWLSADGRRADALAIARAAHERAPDDLTAMRRLSLLLSEGETPAEREEGLKLIDRTLEIAPGNAYALRARAVALRGLERYAEAEADLRAAIELVPDEWRFWQDLGELLMATDKVREGAPILKKAGEMRTQSMGR